MIPPALVLFGVLIVGLIVTSSFHSCTLGPETDNGAVILKGGVEQ